ncbi:hypothetical protein NG99_04900 [Erwinia typographi]|uniref:Fimbrial protein n=1 Tax=Erwinia typographi TaxID=371042 RepID=A0A0A3Z7G6_9GAMM|nr:fimbrial protein [Erwinia typographi]KGT94987.1 hypothetical protein NG99_04900 [Erwinia typographi]
MKSNLIVSAVAATIISLPAIAAAEPDGTITFNGFISSQTCDVSVNGSKDGGVTLPNIVSSLLAEEGQVAGNTTFTVNVKDCATKEGKVRAFFQAGTNVDLATGTLKNNGTAKNVHIQILDPKGNPLKVGDESQRSATNEETLKDGSAALVYSAQYYVTGKSETGVVATSVEYSIDYF